MKENLDKALAFVLQWEGGRSQHPNDPGGLTIYGISSKNYPREVARMNQLWQEGRYSECRKIAVEIYKRNYWDPCKCDTLDYPFDIIVFDTAVNMGCSKALFILKNSKTWQEYLLRRIFEYKALVVKNKNLNVFLVGWLNRVEALYKFISG